MCSISLEREEREKYRTISEDGGRRRDGEREKGGELRTRMSEIAKVVENGPILKQRIISYHWALHQTGLLG